MQTEMFFPLLSNPISSSPPGRSIRREKPVRETAKEKEKEEIKRRRADNVEKSRA